MRSVAVRSSTSSTQRSCTTTLMVQRRTNWLSRSLPTRMPASGPSRLSPVRSSRTTPKSRPTTSLRHGTTVRTRRTVTFRATFSNRSRATRQTKARMCLNFRACRRLTSTPSPSNSKNPPQTSVCGWDTRHLRRCLMSHSTTSRHTVTLRWPQARPLHAC